MLIHQENKQKKPYSKGKSKAMRYLLYADEFDW